MQQISQIDDDDRIPSDSPKLPPNRLQHDRGCIHFNRVSPEQKVYDLCLHYSKGGRRLLGQIEHCSRRGWLINYVERELFHESLGYMTYNEAVDALFAELDDRQRKANAALALA